jgi:hypothetical protein
MPPAVKRRPLTLAAVASLRKLLRGRHDRGDARVFHCSIDQALSRLPPGDHRRARLAGVGRGLRRWQMGVGLLVAGLCAGGASFVSQHIPVDQWLRLVIVGAGSGVGGLLASRFFASAQEPYIRAELLRMGHCPRCGYDLRATPDRCPECGAVPAATAAR